MKKHTLVFWLIFVLLLIVLSTLDLFYGNTQFHLNDVYNALFNFDDTNSNEIIFREVKIPRTFISIIAGSSLAVCGLLMQTIFRNPLTEPYVLGISSGSSLAVATGLLSGAGFLANSFGLISLSIFGAFFFGIIILSFSNIFRNSLSLLLSGIMLGSFTSAITSLMQTFSSAESIKNFMFWGLGSLDKVEFNQIPIIILFYCIGLCFVFISIKPLNALVLGENEAKSLGINVKFSVHLIILTTAILTGIVTTYCGPLMFIGLAIPNLSKMIFKTQKHSTLVLANLLIGANFVLFCDIIIHALENTVMIPINVLTALIGAPFTIFIIIKNLR